MNNDISFMRFVSTYVIPTIYNEALSYEKKLRLIYEKLNEVICEVNNLSDAFVNLQSWINTQLEKYAKDQLTEWLDDGTLAEIINQTIFNELNQKVENNKKEIDIIKNRKFLFIGDSYATHGSEFTTNTWCDFIINYLGLTQGVNAFISQLGGTGFVSTVAGINFETLLNTSLITDKNIITDIIICGGYNDSAYSDDLIAQRIQQTFTTAKNIYPNAKIHCSMIGWHFDDVDAQRRLRGVNNIYHTATIKNGGNYLVDGYTALHQYLTGINSLYPLNVEVGGKFHPNDNGSEIIGYNLSNNILNVKPYLNINNTMTTVAPKTTGIIPVTNLYSRCINNVKSYFFYAFSFVITGITIAQNQAIDVGIIQNTVLCPYDKIDSYVICTISETDEEQYTTMCYLEVNDTNTLTVTLFNLRKSITKDCTIIIGSNILNCDIINS